MVDIMLAHSSKDKAYAEQLHQILQEEQFVDIWDFSQTQPGKIWMEEWFRALREAQVLILLVSPASMESTYVYQAWNYFLVQGKTIIPLILPDTPEDVIPDELSAIYYLDLRKNDTTTQLPQGNKRKKTRKQAPLPLLTAEQQEKLTETLKEVLSRWLSATTAIEFSNVGVLTPESLDKLVMPYVMALSRLQDMMDQAQGKEIQPHRISQIIHYNPNVWDILGLEPVVNEVLTVIIPSKRKLRNLEIREKEANIRDKEVETEGKRLDNLKKLRELDEVAWQSYRLAIQMAEHAAPNLKTDERQFLANQMTPHVQAILESPVEIGHAERFEASGGWRKVT